MHENKRTRASEPGGLTPPQIRALLDDPWDGSGPLQIAENLTAEELDPYYASANARRLLQALLEAGTVRATAQGDLPRWFVGELMQRLRWWPGHLERVRERDGWAPTEFDLDPLYVQRRDLQGAGLIELRDGHFAVTASGRELAAPERAGALHASLFRERFRSGRPAIFQDHRIGGPVLLRMVPYALWRLSELRGDWTSSKTLAPRLVTPEVLEQWDEMCTGPIWLRLEMAMLDELCDFGLLEMRPSAPIGRDFRPSLFRRGPLMGRFVSCRFGAADP